MYLGELKDHLDQGGRVTRQSWEDGTSFNKAEMIYGHVAYDSLVAGDWEALPVKKSVWIAIAKLGDYSSTCGSFHGSSHAYTNEESLLKLDYPKDQYVHLKLEVEGLIQ